MNFQKTTLSIAGGIFLLSLLILVIILYKFYTSLVWPPESSDCPDLWLSYIDSNDKSLCKPNSKLTPDTGNWGNLCQRQSDGSYTCSTMDFTGFPYTSKDKNTAISTKCNWATTRDIHWTGITDVNSKCEPITTDVIIPSLPSTSATMWIIHFTIMITIFISFGGLIYFKKNQK